MKKLIFILLVFFIFPLGLKAQSNESIFKARVSKILEEKIIEGVGGEQSTQQNVQLIGLEGDRLGKVYEFVGIGNFDLVSSVLYEKGDKVIVLESADADGELNYFITDFDRTTPLIFLFAIFVLLLIIVGRGKGVRAIFSLGLSFLVIVKFIIPKILAGGNPLFITFVGSILILIAMIYLTEGMNYISHISTISILASLLFSIFLSWFFVELANLTGVGGEEVASLVYIGAEKINFKGLLLAGIIIGLIGVLDDVVISQVVAVKELNETDPRLTRKKLYKKAYNIGITHISSMTNTLFLAYAGVSLPLLILFSSGTSAFQNVWQAINNESITTEIIRTLAGSIGLILSVPISTILAVFWTKRKE